MELVLRFISFSFVFWYGVKNVDIFYAGQIAQNFELSFISMILKYLKCVFFCGKINFKNKNVQNHAISCFHRNTFPICARPFWHLSVYTEYLLIEK